MGNITIHLECTAGWERGAKFLEQRGVETAFLLNANPDQVQHALNHTTGIVVVRVYDPFNEFAKYGENFEKEGILRHSPQEYVAWLNGRDLGRFKGNKRVRFILGWNEPSYGGTAYQKTINEKMLAIADALVKAQYGVALHGLACDKSLQWEDIQAGIWQATIDWLKANRDWAHLDVHEYALGRMASQHLKSYPVGYPASIIDPVSMRQENWGAIDYKAPTGKSNYHLGRVSWLGGGFPYARGEMGTDYKEDGAIKAWMPSFMAKFGKPEGFPSNRDLYNHLMGKILSDREFCEEINKDLSWFVQFDKDDCLSNAIYADNQSARWQPFNIGQPAYNYLYELLGRQEPMATPQPIEFVMEPKRIRSLKESNIRSALDADSNVLHTIRTEWLEGKFSKNSVRVEGSSFQWHKIEVTVNGVAITGYIAKTLNLVVEDMPIVIPPPAPTLIEIYYMEPYGTTIRATKSEWLAAIESHEFAAKYHTLLVAALKTITPVLEAPLAKAATDSETKTDAAA